MTRETIISALPPFTNKWELVKKSQGVNDIIAEILNSHEIFAKDYDAIAFKFYNKDLAKTFQALYNFCRTYIPYHEESERAQLAQSPAAMLHRGKGDCKSYALFIGGVLSALQRAGIKLKFNYRFADYSYTGTPGHVFVVASYNGAEYWIDPCLKKFNQRLQPTSFIDKQPKSSNMALYRVSGVGQVDAPTAIPIVPDYDTSLPPQLVSALQILLHYGVMNTQGQVNDSLLESLHQQLPATEFQKVADARIYIQNAAKIGGFFDDLWRGVTKVFGAVPRGAYLTLVGLNVFGTATKMFNAIYSNKEGTQYYEPGKKKLYDKWNSMGGDWGKLEAKIKEGAKKKPILGEPVTVTTIIATASSIIAIIAPILKEILATKPPVLDESANLYPYGICSDGITPRNADGSCPYKTGAGLSNNMLLLAGAGILGVYFLTKKKRG